jgi:CheY-like chemotaxis protein/anti-sigma regulatory factor (Ser/Thr protein kinase)
VPKDETVVVTPDVETGVGRLLVTAVSHGVRTPLHSLLGFLELLATTDLDGEARTLLSDARGGGDELLAASDRLLMLVRVLAGDTPGSPQPFAPTDLLREIALALGAKDELWIETNPYLPETLVGDTESLRQLLMELAGNAVRHGGRQARIYAERLSTFTESPVRVRFTISDDGPGLPPDVARRLATPDDRHAEESSQIGLFLARRLARRLGTRLVVPRSEETGTTIMFDVSLYESVAAVPKPVSAEPVAVPVEVSAEPRVLHVLLVEDNSVNRILAQRQMAKLGHRLDVATDGESGVNAVLAGEYDVVLMDRHLPDIDGLETTRRVRAGELARVPARRTPIIGVTADATPGHREECQAAGMDGFLTKPLDLESLRQGLDAVTATPLRVEPDVDPAALDRLSETLDGDATALVELVNTYLDELPARRMRLQAALGRAEAKQVAAAAESLWTSSETVGALRLAQLCAEIHHAARAGDLERGRTLLPALRERCERAADDLDRTVSSLPR